MTAEAHAEAHGPSHGHRNYVKIWAILVALLVVSVCGPMLGIKVVTLITAFGIAIVKAYLVAKNFMHLDIERKYIVYLLVTVVAFMILMFGGVAPDVMSHSGRNWENEAAKAEVARAMTAAGLPVPENAKPKAAPKEEVVAPAVASPAENFRGVCAPCHGDKGEGNGAAAAALNPKPANFADAAFWATRDKAHIEKVIREGGAAVGKSPLMAPFGGRFSAQEISGLAEYVMGLKKP